MPNVSVCLPHELGAAELEQWRTFQREDGRLANPFLSPEFALTLSRHRSDSRVAVLEDGARVVGFLPHQRTVLGLGRGLAYGLGNGHGLIAASDFEWHPDDLLKRCGLTVLEFDYLPAHQGKLLRARSSASAPAPLIDLTSGWDEWIRGRRASSSTVKKVQQNQRKLGREVGEVGFEFSVAGPDVLNLLIRWKSDQYRRTGRSDPFSQPWFTAVVEELTGTTTADFSGVLSVLTVDGRPIAIQQALCANRILSCWFTAYDVSLAGYSPGLSCMLELVHAASVQGLEEVDLGKGHSDYKEVLKDGERTYVEGWVARPSGVATLRRLLKWPSRRALGFVRAHPKLRQAAREALADVGRIRTTLRLR